MNNLITSYSKYILVFLILCYSLFTLTYLKAKSKEARNRISNSQRFFLFVLHFTGFLVLYVQTSDVRMVILYGIEAAFFAAYMIFWRVLYKRSSALITNNICMLLAISYIIQARINVEGAQKQLLMTCIAGAISLVMPVLMKFVKTVSEKARWLVGGAGIAVMALVLVVGRAEYGAKLSLSSIGIPLQPSEFVKISICFFIAAMLAKDSSFRQVVKTTVVVAVNVLILVLCKDLGGALIFFISYLIILFVATQRARYTFAGIGLGAAASLVAYKLFSHVRVRVQVWRDPWEDPTGGSYQVLQGLFAIGTAGWFGMGLFCGAANTIPLAASDFVFAAIAEELGGVFAIALLLVCFENTVQILWLSTSLRTNFDKLLVFGLGTFYGIQVFINVGGVLKIIPCTGVTLPFVSSGGSSVLACFISFALIQSCFIRSDEREELEQLREDYESGEIEDDVTGFKTKSGDDHYLDFDEPEEEIRPRRRRRRIRQHEEPAERPQPHTWSTGAADGYSDDYNGGRVFKRSQGSFNNVIVPEDDSFDGFEDDGYYEDDACDDGDSHAVNSRFDAPIYSSDRPMSFRRRNMDDEDDY